jgi:septal ring factor EnvC (AmiA/AmiB activator)
MRLRPGRLVAIAVVLAVVFVAPGFKCSSAPRRDCAATLAKAQRELRKKDKELKGLRATDKKLLAEFHATSAKLKAIEQKYPNNVLPPKVFTKYKKLQKASDAAYKRYSKSVDATNELIGSRNAVARRYNKATKCDTSK